MVNLHDLIWESENAGYVPPTCPTCCVKGREARSFRFVKDATMWCNNHKHHMYKPIGFQFNRDYDFFGPIDLQDNGKCMKLGELAAKVYKFVDTGVLRQLRLKRSCPFGRVYPFRKTDRDDIGHLSVDIRLNKRRKNGVILTVYFFSDFDEQRERFQQLAEKLLEDLKANSVKFTDLPVVYRVKVQTENPARPFRG